MKYTIYYVYKDGSNRKFQSSTLTRDENVVEWKFVCNKTHNSLSSPNFKEKYHAKV